MSFRCYLWSAACNGDMQRECGANMDYRMYSYQKVEFMRLEPVRKVCRSALIVKYQSDSFAALRRTFRLNWVLAGRQSEHESRYALHPNRLHLVPSDVVTLAEIVRVWLILVMHGFQLSSLSCDFPSSCPRSLPSPSMQHSSNRGGAPKQDEPIALGLPDVVQLSTNGH